MHSRNAGKISRQSIGVVRADGFRNNAAIAKDRCILFTKKVGTAKNLVMMHKEFQSRHFSSPNIDYILLLAVGDRNPDIEAALEFFENNLPSPHVVDVEFLRWKRKWCSIEDADLPTGSSSDSRSMPSKVLP